MEEDVGGLELAVPGALAQVARDDDRGRVEGGKEFLQRLDLLEVGEAAEVEIGEVGDGDCLARCHQITRIRYVSTASPRAGTRTRNRVTVEDTFSAGTELDTTLHSPARSS